MDDPGHEKAHRQAALPDAVGPSVGLSKQQTPKRKYVQVEYEKRRELIQVITREHLTIKSAAEKLNINYPTAKNIVKLYRREQRIEKLPKRPNLTIKKITSPTPKSGDALYNVVLSPFYNEAEAERIMGRHRHDPRMSGQTSQELQAGSDRERQVARTSVTSAQSCIDSLILGSAQRRVPGPGRRYSHGLPGLRGADNAKVTL